MGSVQQHERNEKMIYLGNPGVRPASPVVSVGFPAGSKMRGQVEFGWKEGEIERLDTRPRPSPTPCDEGPSPSEMMDTGVPHPGRRKRTTVAS